MIRKTRIRYAANTLWMTWKLQLGRRRRWQQDRTEEEAAAATTRQCRLLLLSPHGGGSVLDFDDGALDTVVLDHSAQTSRHIGHVALAYPSIKSG